MIGAVGGGKGGGACAARADTVVVLRGLVKTWLEKDTSDMSRDG